MPTNDRIGPTPAADWTAIGDPTLYAEVTLELSGARERTIYAAPSGCTRRPNGAVDFGLFDTDVELTGKGHRWVLAGGPDPKRGYGFGLLEGGSGEDGKRFEWFGPAPDGLARVSDSPTVIDVELREVGGEGRVRVRGTLRCPSHDTASRIPADVVALLRELTGAETRGYTMDTTTDTRESRVVAARVAKQATRAVVAELRKRLPHGYTAYSSGTTLDTDETEVVVAAVQDQLDILRYARTNAANYGIMTEGLIQRLLAWHRRYGVDIVHATPDAVGLAILRPPTPGLAFAREVYELCPDSVDEGVGTISALAKTIEGGELYLWWD